MKPIIAGLLVALITTPAYADWQFTKWGMTPAEVVKASSGSARLTTPKEQRDGSRPGYTAMAIGDYSAGDFQFKADYQFVDGRLKAVGLKLSDFSKCQQLKQSLRAKYGQESTADRNAGPDAEWVDASSGNSISFSRISLIKACFIIYREVNKAAEKAL